MRSVHRSKDSPPTSQSMEDLYVFLSGYRLLLQRVFFSLSTSIRRMSTLDAMSISGATGDSS